MVGRPTMPTRQGEEILIADIDLLYYFLLIIYKYLRTGGNGER